MLRSFVQSFVHSFILSLFLLARRHSFILHDYSFGGAYGRICVSESEFFFSIYLHVDLFVAVPTEELVSSSKWLLV